MFYDSITTLAELKARLTDTKKPSLAIPTAVKERGDMDAFVTIMDALDHLLYESHEDLANSIDLDKALSGTGTTAYYTGTGYFSTLDFRWIDTGAPAWTVDRWSDIKAWLQVDGYAYRIDGNRAGSLDISTTGAPTEATAYSIISEEAPILDYLLSSFGILVPSFATPTQKRSLLRNAHLYNATTGYMDGWLPLKNTVDGWSTYLNILMDVTIEISQPHVKGRTFYFGRRGFGYPDLADINGMAGDDNIAPSYYDDVMQSRAATVTVTGSLADEKKEFIRKSARRFMPMGDSQKLDVTFVYQ